MKGTYHAKTDTLLLVSRDTAVVDSDEVGRGIVINYGYDGMVVSVEVRDASKQVSEPLSIVHKLRALNLSRARPRPRW